MSPTTPAVSETTADPMGYNSQKAGSSTTGELALPAEPVTMTEPAGNSNTDAPTEPTGTTKAAEQNRIAQTEPILGTGGVGYVPIENPSAAIPTGSELKLYFVGTSNVAWQTWPDQLHAMLQGLGYSIVSPKREVAWMEHPTSKAPQCDNIEEYENLVTSRIGKVGWASWGFAYESKQDCLPVDFELQPLYGFLEPYGHRIIAGHNISCVNRWACDPTDQNHSTLVNPYRVAEDAKDANIVLLSNWMNDSKQRWSKNNCFFGANIDFTETSNISVVNLRILINAIRRVNPAVLIVVMSLYPDAIGNFVNEPLLPRIAEINAKVEAEIADSKTFFVKYTFPRKIAVFQVSNPGHANCRGDRVMATRVLQTLFDQGVLMRGLRLPPVAEAGSCFEEPDCENIHDAACCQEAGACILEPSGHCKAFSSGETFWWDR